MQVQCCVNNEWCLNEGGVGVCTYIYVHVNACVHCGSSFTRVICIIVEVVREREREGRGHGKVCSLYNYSVQLTISSCHLLIWCL